MKGLQCEACSFKIPPKPHFCQQCGNSLPNTGQTDLMLVASGVAPGVALIPLNL